MYSVTEGLASEAREQIILYFLWTGTECRSIRGLQSSGGDRFHIGHAVLGAYPHRQRRPLLVVAVLYLHHVSLTSNRDKSHCIQRSVRTVNMQSLRTLRSSEARPRTQGSQKLNKPAPSRSLRKSRVDAKIKKRMSMRYADISSPTGYDIPNVPSIPILSQQQIREEDETVKEIADVKENPLLDDLELLGRESFDPDACMWLSLHHCVVYLIFLKT